MSGHVSLERAKNYVTTRFSSFQDTTEDELKERRNEELDDGSYLSYSFKGETEGILTYNVMILWMFTFSAEITKNVLNVLKT